MSELYVLLVFCERWKYHWTRHAILHHLESFGCLSRDHDRENPHNSDPEARRCRAGLARPAGVGVVIERGGLGGAKRASVTWMDVVVTALGLVVALVPSLGLELAV